MGGCRPGNLKRIKEVSGELCFFSAVELVIFHFCFLSDNTSLGSLMNFRFFKMVFESY